MASSYTVKAGDTLSQIAKALGTSVGNITGYKSGDPNKIGVGEVLSVGAAPGGSTSSSSSGSTSVTPASGSAAGYASTLKSLLGDQNPLDASSATSYKSAATTAASSRDAALKALTDAQTSAYNDEYNASGLADTKKKIGDLESTIAAKKAERDQAVAVSQKNPYASAATLSGDKGKALDAYNAEISDLVDQRNGLAGDYNSGLAEIDKKVATKLAPLQTTYNYWDTQATNANSTLNSYQSALIKALQDQSDNESQQSRYATQDNQWAQDYALRLYQAQHPSSGSGAYNLQLITDPNTGNPKGLFDPRKGTVTQLPGSTGATGFDALSTPTVAPASSGGGFLSGIGNWLKGLF